MNKEVVIIGGSFAGIEAAKTIFAQGAKAVSVTLISSSSKVYFTVSAPRLIVEPEHVSKVLFQVDEVLKKYANGTPYKFIHGSAESTDFQKKTIEVNTSEGLKAINYDYLIIASGTRTESPAFKLNGDYTNTVDALEKLTKLSKSASTIAVVGGGATGVETAGELGYYYGKEKNITLFTGTSGPLSYLGESQSIKAAEQLKNLNVTVVNNKKLVTSEAGTIVFNDGSTETFDLVIPTYASYPNSSFIDKKYLDSKGYLITDDKLTVSDVENVFALGDILSIGENELVDLKLSQMPIFNKLIKSKIFESNNTVNSYKRGKRFQIVPISKNGGVIVLFGWGFPSFLAKLMKSKDFFIPKAGDDWS